LHGNSQLKSGNHTYTSAELGCVARSRTYVEILTDAMKTGCRRSRPFD